MPKKPEPPPPRVLKLAQTILFPLPAPTGLAGWDYCDDEGNVYLVYTSAKPTFIYLSAKQVGQTSAPANKRIPVGVPPSFAGQPITKLSLDSQSATEYAMQSLEGYQTLERMVFSVDHWGNVYALYSAQRSSVAEEGPGARGYVIVKFNDDGSVDSTVRLRNPPSVRLDPMHFQAFADGNFLVTGIAAPLRRPPTQEAGSPHPRKLIIVHHAPPGFRPFTGIFDRSGRLVQELALPGDVNPNSPPDRTGVGSQTVSGTSNAREPTTGKGQRDPLEVPPGMRWEMAVNNSLMVGDPENTVYLLRASNPAILYRLSSDGQVIHQVCIDYPAKNAHPMQMSLAGSSTLWIDFSGMKPDERGGFTSYAIFALVDSETGEITATYRLPGKTVALPLCAAGPNDFLFLGWTKDKKLEVVKYSGN